MEPSEWLIGGTAVALLLGCRIVTRKRVLKPKSKLNEPNAKERWTKC